MTTFKELVQPWVSFKENYVKRSTMSAYTLLLENHVLPFFAELEKIEEHNVQDFVLKKLSEGLSQKSVVDVLIVLKMVVKHGAKRKVFEFSPWDIVYPPKDEKKELEVLTITQYKKIMVYMSENFSFKNMGIFICLSSGMRIGEVCALKWEDLDIDNGIIKIRRTIQRIYTKGQLKKTEVIIDTPKTQSSRREIPMTGDLIKMLKPLKKVVNESFYIISNDLKPMEPRVYRCYYKNLMKFLEMPDLKFHGLRHSFATRCIESKADIKTVSVILGHSNISTTLNIYVHPNNEQKKKAIDHMFKSMKL